MRTLSWVQTPGSFNGSVNSAAVCSVAFRDAHLAWFPLSMKLGVFAHWLVEGFMSRHEVRAYSSLYHLIFRKVLRRQLNTLPVGPSRLYVFISGYLCPCASDYLFAKVGNAIFSHNDDSQSQKLYAFEGAVKS